MTLVSASSAATVADVETACWEDACLAARLFGTLMAGDAWRAPTIRVRAKSGPVLDAWLDALHTYLPKSADFVRVPQGIDAAHLLGGLDISATVERGQPVFSSGLLQKADGGVLLVPMVDAMDPASISIINAALDQEEIVVERDGVSRVDPSRFGLVVIDQSDDDETAMPLSLSDRCMFHIDLSRVSIRSIVPAAHLSLVRESALAKCDDKALESLCQTALAFGLSSLRPVQQSALVASVHANFFGRTTVADEDVVAAMRLCLVQRATQMPPPPPDETQSEPDTIPDEPEAKDEEASQTEGPLEDSVADAVHGTLPEGLLENLLRPVLLRQSDGSGRRGVVQDNFKRGRPLASRSGRPGGDKRLDLIATLRKAAPWQKMRNAQDEGKGRRLHIRSRDFQIRRFKHSAETTTIFAVDASGSTALNRLGEAKGAVELLLAESYARRDNVALVSFRGTGADVLLPPTRALARAKKALAALPGGGGTPLAHGLQAALLLALDEKRKGRQTSVVVLTDGSANVGLNGKGGRAQAAKDAEDIAHGFRKAGLASIVIDVGRKAGKNSSLIAAAMGAELVAMPFANAEALSGVVRAARP